MRSPAAAIGIDIGGTNLRAARISGIGEILEFHAEPIARDPDRVIERIAALCRDLDDASVAGVGVGVPGRVDARTRAVLSGGYLDLSGSALAQRLEALLGKPVVVDNDCNMALVGEMASGAAQGFDNAVMFTIGTGIGGAIAVDGKVLRGRGTGGQLGHVTVKLDGLPCACGRLGCVETTSSGTALGRLIAEAGIPAGTRAEALLDREAAGDPAARAVLDAWALPMRAAIDSVVAAVDPELVLLGGGLGTAAHRALARAPTMSAWYVCPVVPAQLGDDAGVIGAAVSALVEHLIAPEPVGGPGGRAAADTAR